MKRYLIVGLIYIVLLLMASFSKVERNIAQRLMSYILVDTLFSDSSGTGATMTKLDCDTLKIDNMDRTAFGGWVQVIFKYDTIVTGGAYTQGKLPAIHLGYGFLRADRTTRLGLWEKLVFSDSTMQGTATGSRYVVDIEVDSVEFYNEPVHYLVVPDMSEGMFFTVRNLDSTLVSNDRKIPYELIVNIR